MDSVNLSKNDKVNLSKNSGEAESKLTESAGMAMTLGAPLLGAAAAPFLALAGGALAHKSPQTAGSLSSNPGDMLPLEPYLVIYRNQKYYPEEPQIGHMQGLPTNSYVKLSNCHGFTKVKDVNIEISCTQDERAEIESLLKQGVIL